jgi:hypothetical protein
VLAEQVVPLLAVLAAHLTLSVRALLVLKADFKVEQRQLQRLAAVVMVG